MAGGSSSFSRWVLLSLTLSLHEDIVSDSAVASRSSASSSVSSDSVVEGGIAAIAAAMASSNVLPSIMSLESAIICSRPCFAPRLGLVGLLAVSWTAVEDPESQFERFLRLSISVSEGMM